MRFCHTDLEGEFEWRENEHIGELVIEAPKMLRELLGELSNFDGEGKVRVSDGGKAVNFGKAVEVIANPVKLDFNSRTAMTALLKMLVKASVSEDFYMPTNSIKANIVKYLDDLVNAENFEFEVSTEDFLIDALAKAANIHIVGDQDDFVELLTDYMSMMTELVGVKLFIFVNLRGILLEEEFQRLVHNVKNHQLSLLLIEECDRGKAEGIFRRILIDKDLCEL